MHSDFSFRYLITMHKCWEHFSKSRPVSYVCVCVCFLPFHSGHQVRWTYQPGVATQEEGPISAVRALIFLARRIQPFLFLVDREVEFCVLTI